MTIAAFLIVGNAAHAAYDPDVYRALNDALVEDHIVPRYAQLAKATAEFNAIAKSSCDMPSSMRLTNLKDAALAAQDAWQAVEHIRFGPVEQEMRSTRFNFWPDVRDRTGREVADILHSRKRSEFKPENFPNANVVVQGFPALERLLFSKDAGKLLVDGTVDAHFRCSMVRAIATNMSAMAAAIYAEWTEGDDSFAKIVSRAGGEFALYQKAEEATLDMFKSLHGAVEIVADHKLARPMGDSIKDAHPKRAEAWRSGRSLDNIRRNLQAAQAMYLGADGSGNGGMSKFVREVAEDAELDDLLRRAFAQTLATADSIRLPLGAAISDPMERAKLAQLKTEAAALKTILAQRLTAALGIPQGFNALDGD